jgi:hypothetical protein
MSAVFLKGADAVVSAASLSIGVSSVTEGSTLLVGLACKSLATSPVALSTVRWNGLDAVVLVITTIAGMDVAVLSIQNCPAASGSLVASFEDEFGPAAIDEAAATVVEVAGVIAAPIDKFAVGTGTSTSPTSGSTAAILQASEQLVAFLMTMGPSTDAAPTWGGSFAAGQRAGTNTGTAIENTTVADASKPADAIAGYAASASLATSRAWACVLVTLVDSSIANKSKITFTLALGGATQKASLGAPSNTLALSGPMTKTMTIGEE